jgi:G3E family GTPase
VAFGDKILLNKTDLVTPAELEEVERRIREINGGSEIIRCQNAIVPLERILGVRAFDLDRVVDRVPEFLETFAGSGGDGDGHEAAHEHDDGEHSHGHGDHNGHDDEPGGTSDHEHAGGGDGDPATTAAVNRGPAAAAKPKHGHTHAKSVSSLAVVIPGSLDLKKLNEFIATLLRDKGFVTCPLSLEHWFHIRTLVPLFATK